MKRIVAATLFALLALTLLAGAESKQTILRPLRQQTQMALR